MSKNTEPSPRNRTNVGQRSPQCRCVSRIHWVGVFLQLAGLRDFENGLACSPIILVSDQIGFMQELPVLDCVYIASKKLYGAVLTREGQNSLAQYFPLAVKSLSALLLDEASSEPMETQLNRFRFPDTNIRIRCNFNLAFG